MNMARSRWLAVAAACGMLAAQTPVDEPMPEKSDITVPVNVVLAPTTVTDKDGNFIVGLGQGDFTLYDNDRPQPQLVVDVNYRPISMVIAVQASNMVDKVLPDIQRMGNVLQDLVIGDQGEAAVLAFDHRIRVMQDFTADSGRISDALKKITAGSSSHVMIDASMEAIRMLRSRPPDRRRILLLFSETHDRGSQGRIRDVLEAAQFANVLVYSIDISHFLTDVTGTAMPPRPDPIPAEAQHVPPFAPQTPTSIDSDTRDLGNWLNTLPEIFTAAKGIFVDNPVQTLTRYTGGRQFAFIKERALEKAMSQLGDELHSQYFLSYTLPSPRVGGFHRIRVEVDKANLVVRTRPGYWVGPEQR